MQGDASVMIAKPDQALAQHPDQAEGAGAIGCLLPVPKVVRRDRALTLAEAQDGICIAVMCKMLKLISSLWQKPGLQ